MEANAFARLGVTEIGDFFTQDEFETLQRHVDRKTSRGGFRAMNGDRQVAGAPCEYADPLAERLLRRKARSLGDLLQLDLVPTYSYIRVYRTGDRLAAHRDRPACEISVSASLAAVQSWPLHILVEGRVVDFCPAARGAVAFRGHALLHWRDTLSDGGPIPQILFHYVQRDGPHGSWAYDRRVRTGAAGKKTADARDL